MLDGFVVPHAHFRVFHGNAAADSAHRATHDHFPLICVPARAETAPTDLHLREFAQLEAQVKALQQQQVTAAATASGEKTHSAVAAAVNAHAIADVVSGGLAECFSFYTRLMTVESFTWPDFLATVFTKLAEHFAHSANDSVRNAILGVFQQAKAHVAQVNDPTKVQNNVTLSDAHRLLAHVSPLLTSSSARTRATTLKLLETMPTLIQGDGAIHAQLVLKLDADNSEECTAAIAATRSVLPLAPTLQATVFQQLVKSANKENTAVLRLLEVAVANSMQAQQAWNHCGLVYHDVVDDRAAIHCLRAMTSLASAYPSHVLASHVQLLRHAVVHDPRKIVQNFAVLSIQDLISSSNSNVACFDASSGLLACLLDVIQYPNGYAAVKLSALAALELYSRTYELEEQVSRELVYTASQLYTAQSARFGSVCGNIMENVARHTLCSDDALETSAADASSLTMYPLSIIQKLLEFLHPNYFLDSSKVWLSTLACVERLCREFPDALSALIASCYTELIQLADEQQIATGLKTHLFKALSHMSVPSSSVDDSTAAHSRLLLRQLSSLAPNDSSNRAALAVTLFRFLRDTGNDDELLRELENILTNATYATQADRYEVAKLAMLHGYFRLALELLTSVSASTDKECFGGWLLGLRSLCDAEASLLLDSCGGMNSIYQLSRAQTYLKVATTSRYGFDFQHQLVNLRLTWMQLTLQAQQFAGEAEFCNTKGASREEALSARFRDTASQYRAVLGALLGATATDLEILDTHARISELLAMAIDGFLLHRSLESVSRAPQFYQTRKSTSRVAETCDALEADICEKIELLQRIDASRRATLGGKVMKQLLKTICSIPFQIPHQFFRMTMQKERRISSNVQFLTFAENSAFTSKPRSHSQLGVAFGTDFNSLLKGVVAVPANARGFWEKTIDAIDVEVVVCLADTTGGLANPEHQIGSNVVQDRIRAHIPVDWQQQVAEKESSSSLYVPFTLPVHVKAEVLRVKGSFQLLARVAVIDANGDKWPLAATGCKRGFIVY
ncbi:hypothetical protein FI667_g15994, partial [Globisporangium splendens]